MSDAETQATEPVATPPPGTEEPPAEQTADGGAPPTEETAGAEGGGEETKEGETEGAPEQAEEKRKRAGGWQRKIERLERQNQQLIDQLARGTPPPPAAGATPQAPTEADKAQEYVRSLAKQVLAEERQQQEQQSQIEGWTKRTSEVRAANADFDDVVATLPPIPPDSPLGLTLLKSERGPEIMYQLAKSGELAKISRLHPLDAAREIGRLEAQLASSTATRKTNGATPRASAAPAPITPVTARGPSNVKPVEQMSYEEYRAWRDSPRKR